jgi:hypothetical protein
MVASDPGFPGKRMEESFHDGGNHHMKSNDQHQQLLSYSIMYTIYIFNDQWYKNCKLDWFHITTDSGLDQVAVSIANMAGP